MSEYYVAPVERTPRKFKALITWTNSEIDPSLPKEVEAETIQTEINASFDGIIEIVSVENIEEL